MTLYDYMRLHNLTQMEMSRRSGIPQTHFSRWLRNPDTIPSLESAARVHVATGGEVSFTDWLPSDARKDVERTKAVRR